MIDCFKKYTWVRIVYSLCGPYVLQSLDSGEMKCLIAEVHDGARGCLLVSAVGRLSHSVHEPSPLDRPSRTPRMYRGRVKLIVQDQHAARNTTTDNYQVLLSRGSGYKSRGPQRGMNDSQSLLTTASHPSSLLLSTYHT